MAKALQTNNIGYKNYNNRQEQAVELSLEAQIFLSYKHNTINRRKKLKTLLRAHVDIDKQLTNKTKFISPKAVEIANVVLNKLMDGQEVLLSHKYLSKITFCQSSAQNNNIISELANLFDIKYHRFLYKNGHIYEHHIEFTISASIICELRYSSIENTEFYPKKISSSYINNKNTFNKSIRSNESTFSNNSNSYIQLETSNLTSTKEAVVTKENDQETTIHTLKANKLCQTNQRKKKTIAQKKANKAKLLQFKQYDEPKDLAYHYPLTAEDCSILQSKSTRYFNLNAQNQILLAMSRKTDLQGHRFHSKAQFMVYMGKALMHEIRDAVRINNLGFYIKANLTEEQLVECTKLAEREKFLSRIEQQAIIQVSPENQLKAKLANTLVSSKAYKLLSGIKQIQLVGEIMEIHLNSCIDFTEHDENVIISQVKAVYGDVEVKFIMQRVGLKASNSNIQQQESLSSEQAELLQLPQGVWGEVSKELVAKYGVNTYKNWFSKLTATIDEITNTIELKASSGLVQDWVGSRYENSIAQIAATMGFELRGLK